MVAGPVGSQHQNAGIRRILRQEPEELFRYLVNPMEVLEHEYKRPLGTRLDAEPMKDLKGLRLDCFRIRQRGRAANLTDSQEIEKDSTVLLGVHPDRAQARADFFGDCLLGIRLDDFAIAA